MGLEIKLQEMEKKDIESVVNMISRAMNENEGKWAEETIDFHFFCEKHNKNDGRSYYVAKKDNKIIGVCGLHRYIWGSEDIVWLGWFAVDPKSQRKGIGCMMMENLCELASKRGYRKMFIETYSNDDFLKGRNFYEKVGFTKDGEIKSYIKEGIDMIVYARDLSPRST